MSALYILLAKVAAGFALVLALMYAFDKFTDSYREEGRAEATKICVADKEKAIRDQEILAGIGADALKSQLQKAKANYDKRTKDIAAYVAKTEGTSSCVVDAEFLWLFNAGTEPAKQPKN